ncbi:hypothetical protein ACFL5G_00530 [Candidatus Margulisiibacteriota bacterium]
MATNSVSESKQANHAEFKKLHNRLILKYLKKNVSKANQVVMKGEATTAEERAAALSKAEQLAAAEAKAAVNTNKKPEDTKNTTNNAYAACKNAQNEQKKDIKNKTTFDPVQILSKIEKENKQKKDIKKLEKPGLLQSVIAFIGTKKTELKQIANELKKEHKEKIKKSAFKNKA